VSEPKRCPACGAPSEPSAKFCGECGAELVAEPATPSPVESARRCPACGAEQRTPAKFCRDCGAPMAGQPAPVATHAARAGPSLRVIAALATLLVGVVVVGAVVLLMARGGGEGRPLTVLAMNDDPEPSRQAVLYVGHPGEQPFELPQGEYSLLAMDGEGNIAERHASLTADGLVPLGDIDFAGGLTEEERVGNRQSMGRLVEFFTANEYAILSYTERMLRTGGDLSDDDVAAQFDEMTQLQASLENGMGGLQHFAEESSARGASPPYVRAMVPAPSALPAPSPGVVSVLWAWWQWAKSLSGAGEDARGKIVEGMAALPGDRHRQQLLNELDPERRHALGIPDNASDFLNKLKTGELDNNANQIHQELCQASTDPTANLEHLADYYNQAQKTGSRPIDQAHKHGTEMVEQGTRFVLEGAKEVIGTAEGSEKIKKFLSGAIDKSTLVYDLLSKPQETLSKEGIKKALERDLKERLKGLGISEDEVDGMIGVLTDKLFDWFKDTNPSSVEAPKATAGAKAVLGPVTPEAQQELPPTLPPLAARETPVPTPRRTPTTAPETATPAEETPPPTATPDMGWIDGYVQGIAEQWLAKGYSGIDVAVYADDLRQCLTEEVIGGASRDEAMAACPPSLFEPAEATPVPQPTQAPTPQPPPEATSPPPPPPPPPQGQQVTAVGRFLNLTTPEQTAPCEWTKNTITLAFDTRGGTVTGQGHTYLDCPQGYGGTGGDEYRFEGTYSADTGQFSGTVEDTYTSGGGPAVVFTHTWHATLTDGYVSGTIDGSTYASIFELTVQG